MVSASKHVLCGSFLSDVLFEWMSLEDLTKLETATLGCVEIKSMWNGFLLREVKEKKTISLSGNEASVLQNIRQLAWYVKYQCRLVDVVLENVTKFSVRGNASALRFLANDQTMPGMLNICAGKFEVGADGRVVPHDFMLLKASSFLFASCSTLWINLKNLEVIECDAEWAYGLLDLIQCKHLEVVTIKCKQEAWNSLDFTVVLLKLIQENQKLKSIVFQAVQRFSGVVFVDVVRLYGPNEQHKHLFDDVALQTFHPHWFGKTKTVPYNVDLSSY